MNTVAMLPAADASGVTPSGTAWSSYGAGAPIVFIHGVGMSQCVWSPQVHGLRGEFQIVLLDMMGHGGSPFVEGHWDIGNYANQVSNLLNDLKIDSAHIVGHSMGALIALEMAIAHPAQCESVAALNGVYCRSAEQRASVQARAMELATKGKPDNVRDTIHRWFGEPIPAQDLAAAELSERLLIEVPQAGYAKAYDVFANSDERHLGRLSSIRVPTLIATGELDPNSSPAMARAMQALIPRAKLQVLAGKRHMMSLTAVDAINSMIRNFATLNLNGTQPHVKS